MQGSVASPRGGRGTSGRGKNRGRGRGGRGRGRGRGHGHGHGRGGAGAAHRATTATTTPEHISDALSLINFQYPLINASDLTDQSRIRRQRRRAQQQQQSIKQFHNVKARFRFILAKSDRDPTSIDAVDDRVDWDYVELVECPVDQVPRCPVCLDTPIAPRLTKCGHSFCFSCMLRYLSLSPHNFSRCLLCFDSVYVRDLKSLVFSVRSPRRVDDTVSFTLLTRPKKSVVPYAATSADVDNDDDDAHIYSRLFGFASVVVGADASCSLLKDRMQLIEAINFADELELPFLSRALEDVQMRIREKARQDLQQTQRHANTDTEALASASETDQNYRFYQASDAQHIYLDSLCYRCLEAEFGDTVNIPSSFSARITALQPFRQTQDLRLKYRYLSHLTLSTPFALCEVDLSSIVSKKTLRRFEPEFAKRRRKRDQTRNRQQQHDILAQERAREEEARRLRGNGRYNVAGPSPSSSSSSSNPFGFSISEVGIDSASFGPALGLAESVSASVSEASLNSWSVVADRGLAASHAAPSVWHALPNSTSTSMPDQSGIVPSWPARTARTNAAAAASSSGSAASASASARAKFLFSNSSARRYNN